MRSIKSWQASAILNRSPAGPTMGFHYSLNPYRGCSHACRYCYARESHTYLDLNVAEDFEQQLFVKENLKDRLHAELARVPLDQVIAIGTVTDPYQPLEGRHHLTRTAIELLAESGHAFTLTTKSPLIERDLDLLEPLGRRGQVGVHVSLMSLDREMLHRLEPGTSPPARRLDIIRRLHEHRIPVGTFVAPIVPVLTDHKESLDALFAALKEAGSDWIMTSSTRLSDAIRPYFFAQIEAFDPQAAESIRALYRDTPFADRVYQRRLQTLLQTLYQRHHMSRTGPLLQPYRTESQMEFSFD